MQNTQHVIRTELDPQQPVSEICQVITLMLQYNPQHEEEILQGVQEAMDRYREQLEERKPKKGEDQDGE